MHSGNFALRLLRMRTHLISGYFTNTWLRFSNGRVLEQTTNASKSTINTNEVEKFGKQSSEWWEESFAALRAMNVLRVPLVRDGMLSDFGNIDPSKPLANFRILDVGCGGGLLSEPLARLGAAVTGLDPSAKNIEKATEHASMDSEIKANITYVCDSVENYKSKTEPFDAVVCSEVIEHVNNVPYFAQCCVDMVRNGGSVFFTTINQTALSYLVAIIGAEYLLKIIPLGTHDWNQFVKPKDLESILENHGCRIVSVQGMMFNPFTSNWSWSPMTSVSYAIHAIKHT